MRFLLTSSLAIINDYLVNMNDYPNPKKLIKCCFYNFGRVRFTAVPNDEPS